MPVRESCSFKNCKSRVAGIIGIRPEGDKASRMAVASAKFEAGQALLPERAPWLADLEAELFAFPGGKHDDQCDSISQALLDNNISWAQMLTPADWQEVLAMARIPYRRRLELVLGFTATIGPRRTK